MSAAATPAEPTQPAILPEDEAYFRQMLREMAEHGMNILRKAEADPELSFVAKAEIFDRVSRAVRRTILLEMHIIAQRKRTAQAAAPRPPRPITDADIARANRTEPPPDRLTRGERVETVERERALFARPIPEIIAVIMHDLRPIHALRPANDRAPHPDAAPPDPSHPHDQPPSHGPPPDDPKS